jgi:hypothetical protein
MLEVGPAAVLRLHPSLSWVPAECVCATFRVSSGLSLTLNVGSRQCSVGTLRTKPCFEDVAVVNKNPATSWCCMVNACSTYKCSIISASGSKHTTPGPSPARCVLPPVWYEQMRHVMNSYHPATTTPQTQTQLTSATVHILLVLN